MEPQYLNTMLPMLMVQGDEHSMYSKIISALFVLLLSQVMPALYIATMRLWTRCSSSWFSKPNVYIVKYTVTYKNQSLYSSNGSPYYKPLLRALNNKIANDQNTKLKYSIVSDNGLESILFSPEHQIYHLTDQVYVQHMKTTRICDARNSKEDVNCENYEFRLMTKDNNMATIADFVEKVYEEYERDILTNFKTLQIFTVKGFDGTNSTPQCTILKFNSTKTFDNMFFEGKERLMSIIDSFEKHGYERSVKLGMPHTLGMLFHGEPGTGKTSAIKAIAHYTQRHIVIVPVRHINTVEKLKAIFMCERLNGLTIPMDKRLYVFEEIDCSHWRDIVLSRKLRADDEHHEKAVSRVGDLADCIKSALCTEKPKDKEDDDLCLGDLLEVLDGMVEVSGRMYIMTSNHPEVLDPALCRPGRIDLQHEFKKLTRANINDMYKLWFDADIPANIFEKTKDYTFTQAEIGNLFANNDRRHIHKALCV